MKEIYRYIVIAIELAINIVSVIIYSASPWKKSALKYNKTQCNRSCVIVMNGPNLSSDLVTLDHTAHDVVVCNHFADTDWYEKLKPEIYVLADPYFYADDACSSLKKKRDMTLENIINKTSWPLTLIAPNYNAFLFLFDKLSVNQMIAVRWVNGKSVPVKNLVSTSMFWRYNLLAPPGNVLVGSLYAAWRSGYSKIYLVGATWNFHLGIMVDQETNVFYKKRKHVYGEVIEESFTDHRRLVRANLEHEFGAIYRSFILLRLLRQFLSCHDVKVINCSKDSFIDVFDRP